MRSVRLSPGLQCLRLAALACIVLGIAGAPAAAAEEEQLPTPKADFLFGAPRGYVALRGTWLVPAAGGDLFAFVSDQLTVNRQDFHTPAVIAEVGFSLTPRISVSADLEGSHRSIKSEYRHFIDNFGNPINQTTALTQQNVSASVKLLLLSPGRSISRLAYVPRGFVPYVGAGAGMLYYRFDQKGDFVDFATLKVFPDYFSSKGWSPSAHVLAGTAIQVWRVLFVDVEGRYVWAHGTLGSDFVGFDGIDLDGFRLSTGFHISF